MLLANYASDSDAESDAESDADTNAPAPSTSRLAAPAPRASAPAGGAAKKKRGPVKITLDRPKPSSSDDPEASRELADEVKDEREAKKPKLAGRLKGGGPGGSSLLGMLPPPKSKLPVPTTDGKKSLAVINSMAAKPRASLLETAANGELDGDDDPDDVPGRLLLPSSIARAKAKATVQSEPAVDLFGLTPAPAPLESSSFAQPKAGPSRPLISSAPTVADFVPPPPTPSDPYPGYYLLPSGSWAAYEPAYYHSFFPDNQPDKVKEKGEDGRVGKHWDEYDTRGGEIVDIDVGKGLEEARREEERREKLKKPKVAGEEYEYKTIGQTKGLAAQRHQLTSLLHTAYGQREELEERIQANKKNMRLAGQKYGF